MLSIRIIPCLDVMEGRVVKGVQFRNHQDLGAIEEHVDYYLESGADELVFYDITASAEERMVSLEWITRVAKRLDIPFCVAGGIRSIEEARAVFKAGADKISINSPALLRPELIRELALEFGSQSIVVGVDSFEHQGEYQVFQYTGKEESTCKTPYSTSAWLQIVQDLGAGEIVLNCMNQDGVCRGYDLKQLSVMRPLVQVPLIASGGAGCMEDFLNVFNETKVEAALAASVFHKRQIAIPKLKQFLKQSQLVVRT
jgi:cyclase